MRILYLSLSYVPSRRASSVQVTKMCAAFARRGHDVVLVAKRGTEPMTLDDHAFYGVEHNFAIEKLARPPRRGGGVVYGVGIAGQLAQRRRWADLVYCRDPLGAWLASEAGMPAVFEAHGVPPSNWIRRLLARAVARPSALGVVAISEALRRDLEGAGLIGRGFGVVAHDACDPPVERTVPRSLHDPPVVGYVGNLYPGRGIDTIFTIARAMPRCRFRIVGGTERDVARWRALGHPDNVELLGFMRQPELPACYRGFDVVLMPHARTGVVGATGASDISRWTSPMKMFEYMASGVPLVASALPVLREVLRDGDNALLVESDDAGAWGRAITRLLDDDALRYRLAVTAQQELIDRYTWDARADRVLAAVQAQL